jgi:uncharacterized protein (TIGR00730 family)
MTKKVHITVFGGSQPKPGDPAYLQAHQLGRMLGQEGYVVQTGGYIGTMEAVSKGANEVGAHVVGITCAQIETWRPTGKNQWVIEEKRYETLRDRLFALIDTCDAAIALPSGVGTLAEISLFWNELAVEAMRPKPIIVIGKEWKTLIQVFFQELGTYISKTHQELILYAEDGEEAIRLLKEYFH